MGGNLFKDRTRRYERGEFETLVRRIERELSPHFADLAMLPTFADKRSFGDADFLVALRPGTSLLEVLKQRVGDAPIVRNGPTCSFVVEELQVDITVFPIEKMACALMYYGCELGNLLGKITKVMLGLRLKPEGLFYPVYFQPNRTELLAEVLLSDDPEAILNFLDVHPPSGGFESPPQMFQAIRSSRFFHKRVFEEKLNHEDRRRSRQRKVYQDFLLYIEAIRDESPLSPLDPGRVDAMIEEFFRIPISAIRAEKIEREADRKRIRSVLVDTFRSMGCDNQSLGERMRGFLAENPLPGLSGLSESQIREKVARFLSKPRLEPSRDDESPGP
ncbi:MAG: hypothetical protein AB7T14_06580 [Candidatus Methylacidiphilaceae bacterium]